MKIVRYIRRLKDKRIRYKHIKFVNCKAENVYDCVLNECDVNECMNDVNDDLMNAFFGHVEVIVGNVIIRLTKYTLEERKKCLKVL
jgi:hypothetical protein